MFGVIVFGTDGSDTADHALPLVRRLSGEGGRIVLVHANEVIVGRGGAYPRFANEDELRAKVEQQARALEQEGFDAQLRVVRAVGTDTAHVIADVARDERADVIVVGTRGHSTLAGLLVGSVTQRLLHVAPCPVVAVPPIRDPHDEPEQATAAGAAG